LILENNFFFARVINFHGIVQYFAFSELSQVEDENSRVEILMRRR
jgi:hypothetical protein